MTNKPARAASAVTGRLGARVALALGILVAVVITVLLGSVEAPPRGSGVPDGAESAGVAEQLEQRPGSDIAPVLLVGSRGDGSELTDADLGYLADLGTTLGEQTGHQASPPRPSEDGQAAMVAVPMTLSAQSTGDAETIGALRDRVADSPTPPGLEVSITGGPAFGADVASAFDGADLRLLLVTVAVVAVLLLLTYRSPVLWLVPLAVVGLADQVAGRVAAAAGSLSGLDFDAGIVSVLVFGAGTNYALLLISRYREELRREADHRLALARALTATTPAILASNLTVVLALLTLLLAAVPSTRGLGLASAAGLLVALAAALIVLPAALALCGRRIFWPFVPQPGTEGEQAKGVWGRVASAVGRRPAAVLTAGTVLLAVLASGLLGTSVGLSQEDSFRGGSESARGLAVVAEHFPAGETAPLTITAAARAVPGVQAAAEDVPGVVSVRPSGAPADGTAVLTVVGEPAPGTPASRELVASLRDAVHEVPGAEALVGGASAESLDAREAAKRDLLVVAPLILAVVALVLLVLLRSVLAPLVLLTLNIASAMAALGLGSFLSRTVLGFPALDTAVPLMAFLFLVALGVDYTIFLVHRARHEAATHGTRAGMVRAVERTGAVITSAGIVLAGVFAALGVLPLVVLAQLGLIVGIGILIDTLLVRTMLVPAAVEILGDRFWWPAAAPSRGASRR
ncbi:MMPL family transporter [Marihabitans asiaticum]|uniref:RND superfamily putative drug exporter n=1 Tax=Marihabitans asiaticum TaxID=415218 RepID=A0A560WAH9_9MICO|nr:MMPL family transporter [Marihabitans asiaticum]TWD14550.1 RND superfamily putative drug exporter [Marihabitans asiaticum]